MTVAPRLFIVHAPEDTAFVAGFLLPELGLPAADVLRSEQLTPGEPIIDELERGALSPLTLAVLTPAFQNSRWARFAEQLAQTAAVPDPTVATAAVVPAILETCDLRLLQRFRVPLDFRDTRREHWVAEVARLR